MLRTVGLNSVYVVIKGGGDRSPKDVHSLSLSLPSVLPLSLSRSAERVPSMTASDSATDRTPAIPANHR